MIQITMPDISEQTQITMLVLTMNYGELSEHLIALMMELEMKKQDSKSLEMNQ